MENKYYTPEIEEFKVGFEFEQFGKYTEFKVCQNTYGYYSKIGETIETVGWKPKVCEEFDFEDLEEYLENDLIRTKYLDQEDIESLGFNLNVKTENKKGTISQSQKMMVFVLTMSLYGLATLFSELILKIVRFTSRTNKIKSWLIFEPTLSTL